MRRGAERIALPTCNNMAIHNFYASVVIQESSDYPPPRRRLSVDIPTRRDMFPFSNSAPPSPLAALPPLTCRARGGPRRCRKFHDVSVAISSTRNEGGGKSLRYRDSMHDTRSASLLFSGFTTVNANHREHREHCCPRWRKHMEFQLRRGSLDNGEVRVDVATSWLRYVLLAPANT